MPHHARKFLVVAVLATGLVPAGATAYWGPSVVTLASGSFEQRDPATCTDGEGGAIVAWYARGATNGTILARKVDAWGRLLWPSGGVQLSADNIGSGTIRSVADGTGGAIVVWTCPVGTTKGFFAQRVGADGDVLWTAGGVAVCSPVTYIAVGPPVADGAGGAYVCWEQSNPTTNYRSVRVQHIDAAGSLQWDPLGVDTGAPAPSQTVPDAAGDGSGGVIVTWQDNRSGTADIYVQAFDAAGTARWTAGGVPVCTAAGNQQAPKVASDGSGGAVITWWSGSGLEPQEVYAQSVNSLGSPRWAVNGIFVAGGKYPKIASDCQGGTVLAFEDAYPSSGLLVQRLAPAGAKLWAAAGVRVCDRLLAMSALSVTGDGAGGIIVSSVCWETDPDAYCLQWVDADGTLQWDNTEQTVGNAEYNIYYGSAYDGGGGVIVALGGATDVTVTSVTTGRIPTISAGGPYVTKEGFAPHLVPTVANWDGDNVLVEWDLNGDREYGEYTGGAGDVPWETMAMLEPPVPVGMTREIRARVTNFDGLSAWAYAQLTIEPGPLTACIEAAPTTVAPGLGVHVDARCSTSADPNLPIVAWDWFWDNQGVPVSNEMSAVVYPPYPTGTLATDHVLRLRVYDETGLWVQRSQAIHVAAPISWCNLQGPYVTGSVPGVASEPIYGRLRIDGVTSQAGPAPHVVARLGYGPVGTLPAQGGWTWVPGAYQADQGDDDEYMARISAPAEGTYDYAWEYSYYDGGWSFGDRDGSGNGYSPAMAGRFTASLASGVPGAAVTDLRLLPAEPNPFNPRTTLRFELPAAASVRLEVYDVAGRRVRTLVAADLAAGPHEVRWDGRDGAGRGLPSGSYLARLVAGDRLLTTRLTLVR